MSTLSFLKIIAIVVFVGSIIVSNILRSSSSNLVNKIIQDAKKLSNKNKNLEAIKILKIALSEVLSIQKNEWSLYELKDNINTNGWFILNELKRLYSLENISFDITNWKKIIGALNGVERLTEDNDLMASIKRAFHDLP